MLSECAAGSDCMLRSLWRFRGFIADSVLREFRTRYAGSLLGASWNLINPLVQILIYTLVFSEVMRSRLPGNGNDAYAYSIFLCAGVLPWQFFTELVGRGSGVFVENANLLKKSSFPRVALPVVTLLVALVNFCVTWFIFLLFLALVGRLPSLGAALAVLPYFGLLGALGFGLALLVGTLNVFFRDATQLISIVLQLSFWLTPIVWPASTIPPRFAYLLSFNPFYAAIAPIQQAFLGNPVSAATQGVAALALCATFCLTVGYVLYRHWAPEFADEL